MHTQTLDIPVVWPDYFEDCAQCSERLRDTLAGLTGMQSVTLGEDGRTLHVTYDKELLTFEEIRERARLVGVTVAERYKHVCIRIAGLDCPDCATKLEKAVGKLRGVAWASLNYATSTMIVEFQPDKTDLTAVKKRIRSLGYDVEDEEKALRAGLLPSAQNLRVMLTVVSGVLIAAAASVNLLSGPRSLSDVLFVLAAVSSGMPIAKAGIQSALGLTLDTSFLVTAAAAGAIAMGEYGEAAAVTFLFSLGSALEAHTVDKARRSIRSLVDAVPRQVTVRRDGRLEEQPVENVEIGEIVLIKPGQRVAVDGVVVQGRSAVDEAPITGEPVPREKAVGDQIYAGSVNGRGALEVRVTSRAEDNTLSRIIHLVEEAQAQKAPSQRFSEAFGRIYTPCVVFLAVGTAVVGPVFLGGTYQQWILKSLTLLIVSCPCALVISTPVAIVAAIGSAAKSGVLIKGGMHLETLSRITTVAFDKTGTLTQGRTEVSNVIAFDGHSERDVVATAAAVESRSEHPLAEAILARAKSMDVELEHVYFFEAMPGRGARAVTDQGAVYVGSERLLEELNIAPPASDAVDRALRQGKSVVYVVREDTVLGALSIEDPIKEGSAEAIEALRRNGVRRTILLSGDNPATAAIVAALLGIDSHEARLLPQDKLARINELRRAGHRVAMVGDGINDAPALAAADVGIAMGGIGSQAAIEAADVALMGDDIVMLPHAVALSRRARAVIIQNISFAIFVVGALAAGALTDHVTLSTGILGHEGSALLVIANSMRLLKRTDTASRAIN